MENIISERERNRRLLNLLKGLMDMDRIEEVELIQTMVKNDTPSMINTFNFMAGKYIESKYGQKDTERT